MAFGISRDQFAGGVQMRVFANTGENIQDFASIPLGVLHTVCSDERQSMCARQIDQFSINAFFAANEMPLDFNENIFAAESIEFNSTAAESRLCAAASALARIILLCEISASSGCGATELVAWLKLVAHTKATNTAVAKTFANSFKKWFLINNSLSFGLFTPSPQTRKRAFPARFSTLPSLISTHYELWMNIRQPWLFDLFLYRRNNLTTQKHPV